MQNAGQLDSLLSCEFGQFDVTHFPVFTIDNLCRLRLSEYVHEEHCPRCPLGPAIKRHAFFAVVEGMRIQHVHVQRDDRFLAVNGVRRSQKKRRNVQGVSGSAGRTVRGWAFSYLANHRIIQR